MSVYSSFPDGFTPNKAQEYILEEIDEALKENKKFILINAPTGVGKSFIAKSVANYSKKCSKSFLNAVRNNIIWADNAKELLEESTFENFGTAILTVSKNLQDQYNILFHDGESLKGKNAYPCGVNDTISCDYGNCLLDPKQKNICLSKNICPYYKTRNETVINKCGFYNYAMYNCINPLVKNKQFVICDEASELESEYVNLYTVNIKHKTIKSVISEEEIPLIPENKENYDLFITWCSDMLNLTNYKIDSFLSSIKKTKSGSNRKTKMLKSEYNKYSTLKSIKESLEKAITVLTKSNCIIKVDKNELSFVPINIDKIIEENVFETAETVILMSATFVDHEKTAKRLGIEDYYYIECDSPFDSKKAPIKICDKFKINYYNIDKIISQLSAMVWAICSNHPNEKGCIHTHSMSLMNKLKDNLPYSDRFLFREEGISNENILYEHTISKSSTILVSPSLTHGVDLKGDLARFQIILKAPFLPLGDERIKYIFEKDKDWYIDAMLSTLIQTCGRGNRTKDDYCITYILDANILDKIAENKDKLPKYFLNRIY